MTTPTTDAAENQSQATQSHDAAQSNVPAETENAVEKSEQTTRSRLGSVKEVIAYLASQYPDCFSAEGPAKPLKVGIFQDLAANLDADSPVSKTQLRQALRVYTSSWRYLQSVQLDAARVDLAGQEVAKIDAQQAEHAANTLAESKAKVAEQRKQRARASQAEKTAGQKATNAPNKKVMNKKPAGRSNTQALKSKVNQKPAAAVKKQQQANLTPVADATLTTGAKVLVRLGQAPMPATVTEISRNEVTVQLQSGMVIKTSRESLYQQE